MAHLTLLDSLTVGLFAHAFGERYELPIPLALFVIGGALVVIVSFILVLSTKIQPNKTIVMKDKTAEGRPSQLLLLISLVASLLFVACGLFGRQQSAENLVPTLFWLVVWIAVPLSCGIVGDWTRSINPAANIARILDSDKLRQLVIGRSQHLMWPSRLGWWVAAGLFFALAVSELVFNQVATLPQAIATAILGYIALSGLLGLLFGAQWIRRGEVFSVLFSTWGKLGYFRFGTPGKRGFAGGLTTRFDETLSRTAFILLLLASVSFDGLLSTPFWQAVQHRLPASFEVGTFGYQLMTIAVFAGLTLTMWGVFLGFSSAVRHFGQLKATSRAILSGLLPSLLPISFGYLLAHNIEYLAVNGQLLFPLIGNPLGTEQWPLHLPYPFNDNFEPIIRLLPSSFYWYFALVTIVLVHIAAVVIAHHYLATINKQAKRARQSEYPWMVAMVLYTMLSLWLLAQPLVKESHHSASKISVATHA